MGPTGGRRRASRDRVHHVALHCRSGIRGRGRFRSRQDRGFCRLGPVGRNRRHAALDCGARRGAMSEEGVDRQLCVGPLTPIPALAQRPHVDADDRVGAGRCARSPPSWNQGGRRERRDDLRRHGAQAVGEAVAPASGYYCGAAGVVPAGAGAGVPWRRVLRRVWRPVRRVWRRFIPWVPVVAAGAAAGAASCASASDGSSAADTVNPSAAPRPSRASAFRRETFSLINILPFSSPKSPFGNQEPFRMNSG